jgi:hypothetical protein
MTLGRPNHRQWKLTLRIGRPPRCSFLLSALRFHGLTTQNPHEVWIAIGVKATKPVADWPPLHVVRFPGEALTSGSNSTSSRASRCACARAHSRGESLRKVAQSKLV